MIDLDSPVECSVGHDTPPSHESFAPSALRRAFLGPSREVRTMPSLGVSSLDLGGWPARAIGPATLLFRETLSRLARLIPAPGRFPIPPTLRLHPLAVWDGIMTATLFTPAQPRFAVESLRDRAVLFACSISLLLGAERLGFRDPHNHGSQRKCVHRRRTKRPS